MEKKMFKKSLMALFLVGILVVLSACASHVALTKENKTSLKTVSVSQHVSKPDSIKVIGIRRIAQDEAEARLKFVMEREGIDLAQISREKFIAELKTWEWPFAIVERGGDAEFKLAIVRAQFWQTIGFNDNLNLRISMEASLVKQDGTILWKDLAVRTVELSRASASDIFNECIRDPKLIRKAFSFCTDFICYSLVHNLWGK